MELQADRTETAQTGPPQVAEPPEVAEPLCAAPLRGAVRSAPLQEIAETVSRALAHLTDRLIWPYCLPLMAERFMMLHYEIEWAHGAYIRSAERNCVNRICSDLHDRPARLLGNSLLDERDHTPRSRSGNNEVISVQDPRLARSQWCGTAAGAALGVQRFQRVQGVRGANGPCQSAEAPACSMTTSTAFQEA